MTKLEIASQIVSLIHDFEDIDSLPTSALLERSRAIFDLTKQTKKQLLEIRAAAWKDYINRYSIV